MFDSATTLDRRRGVHGELVLRQVGGDLEIISNGVFLMDTRNGESERLLVTAPLDRLAGRPKLLIGGLGVGFSLAAAVSCDRVAAITVVECESAVIDWHAGPLRRWSAGALDDPRVRVVQADLPAWLADTDDRFDAVCLDIDNGPDWTVSSANDRLYDDVGISMIAGLLRPGGQLAVWSAAVSPRFESRLRSHFERVGTRTVPVSRGEPDVIYLAGTRH